MELVHDFRNLKAVVEKMCTSKQRYVDFSNSDGTIHFVMFAEKIDDEIMIDISFDESLKNKSAISVLSHTGDEEDDDFFGILTYHIPSSGDDDREYEHLSKDINETVGMSICPCEKRFKYADDDVCLHCILSCPVYYKEVPHEFCCVCQKHTTSIGMKSLPCCGNHIHRSCSKPLDACPYCRTKI